MSVARDLSLWLKTIHDKQKKHVTQYFLQGYQQILKQTLQYTSVLNLQLTRLRRFESKLIITVFKGAQRIIEGKRIKQSPFKNYQTPPHYTDDT